MRGGQGNLMGRFTTMYEVQSIGGGITQDLQNPVGQSVLWWVFNPDDTQVDPTYDVGAYWSHGRVWFSPFEIPVVLATIEQGAGGHNERGLYTVDMLRLVINTPEILPYIPTIVWEPDRHLNDRVEYRGGLFQPTLVMPKGHVQHDMVVIRVELEQIKDGQHRMAWQVIHGMKHGERIGDLHPQQHQIPHQINPQPHHHFHLLPL